MRVCALLLLLTVALACCSKKEPPAAAAGPEGAAPAAEGEQAAAEPVAEAPAPEQPPPPEPDPAVQEQLNADLQAVPTALQGQDYDGAVDSLATIGLAPKTAAQQEAYLQQLYQTQEYLRQRAEEDARARAAYQRLGRTMTGR